MSVQCFHETIRADGYVAPRGRSGYGHRDEGLKLMTRLDRRSPLAACGSAWPWPTRDAARLATCFDGCGALTLTRERWRRNSRGHDVIEYLQERRCVRFTCIPSRGVRMQTFDVPAASRPPMRWPAFERPVAVSA